MYFVTALKRSAMNGEHHGVLFWCDPRDRSFRELIRLETPLLSKNPRGGDRGFRGVALDHKRSHILITTYDSVLVLNFEMEIVKVFKHPLLLHAHDLSIHDDNCYVCSTGNDLIMQFNLETGSLDFYYKINNITDDVHCFPGHESYSIVGSYSKTYSHINSVYAIHNGFIVSGARSGKVYKVEIGAVKAKAILSISYGSHNSMPIGNEIVFLDTYSHKIGISENGSISYIPIPRLPYKMHASLKIDSNATPYFARGLCLEGSHFAVFGYSPISICTIDTKKKKIVDNWNIGADVSWMVSGIEATAGFVPETHNLKTLGYLDF